MKWSYSNNVNINLSRFCFKSRKTVFENFNLQINHSSIFFSYLYGYVPVRLMMILLLLSSTTSSILNTRVIVVPYRKKIKRFILFLYFTLYWSRCSSRKETALLTMQGSSFGQVTHRQEKKVNLEKYDETLLTSM